MSSGPGPGMSNVYAVVEGNSEQGLAEQVLATYLGAKNIFFQAARVGKPGHKGGNRWNVARKDILNFLKMSRPERLVSCDHDIWLLRAAARLAWARSS